MRTVPTVVVGKIVKEYDVGLARVIVTEANDRHYYIIREPELSDTEIALYSELMEAIYYSFRSSGKGDQLSELENFI